MEYNKSLGGAWLDTSKVVTGSKVKILNETTKRESAFKDKEGNPKTENVAKVQVQGESDSVNMRLNWTTIFGLIDAFGNDSKEWIGRTLTLSKIRALVGDTMRDIVYLIPEGFELGENAESKLEIRKMSVAAPSVSEPSPEGNLSDGSEPPAF